MKSLFLTALTAVNAQIELLPVDSPCKNNYSGCETGLCCGAGILTTD